MALLYSINFSQILYYLIIITFTYSSSQLLQDPRGSIFTNKELYRNILHESYRTWNTYYDYELKQKVECCVRYVRPTSTVIYHWCRDNVPHSALTLWNIAPDLQIREYFVLPWEAQCDNPPHLPLWLYMCFGLFVFDCHSSVTKNGPPETLI